MEKINLKSDLPAKEAFKKFLENKKEYDSIKITSTPADITALKGKIKYYFEIKFTRQTKNYFGAATLTEWNAAIENPGRFWFILAFENKGQWEFREYTSKEFMELNTIPPFKTYFNIPFIKSDKKSKKETRSIKLTENRLDKMRKLWKELV